MTEDKMVGLHHRLNEHEFEQTPGDGEGQGCLECWSPCGCEESDTTERLNNTIILTWYGLEPYFKICMHIYPILSALQFNLETMKEAVNDGQMQLKP